MSRSPLLPPSYLLSSARCSLLHKRPRRRLLVAKPSIGPSTLTSQRHPQSLPVKSSPQGITMIHDVVSNRFDSSRVYTPDNLQKTEGKLKRKIACETCRKARAKCDSGENFTYPCSRCTKKGALCKPAKSAKEAASDRVHEMHERPSFRCSRTLNDGGSDSGGSPEPPPPRAESRQGQTYRSAIGTHEPNISSTQIISVPDFNTIPIPVKGYARNIHQTIEAPCAYNVGQFDLIKSTEEYMRATMHYNTSFISTPQTPHSGASSWNVAQGGGPNIIPFSECSYYDNLNLNIPVSSIGGIYGSYTS